MIQKWKGLYTSGSTAATGRLVDMHAVHHGYSLLCLDVENAYFHAGEDEEVYCWRLKEWNQKYHAKGGRVENPWWMLKGQLYGGRKAAKKLNEFEQCPEQSSLFQRPRRLLLVRKQSTSSPQMRLLKCRPDIAFAVHEFSKTLAHPGDADFRRLRQLGRYLLDAQNLGIMVRNCNDPEHLDAYTDADWSGDSISRKSTSGGILKIRSATL